jgi:pimeloyl-ACP methyl ester carboxylesterase
VARWLRPIAGTRRGRLLARLLLYGGFVLVGLPLAFSLVLTRTYRSPISAGPAAGYEPVPIVADGLKLRAWLARADHGDGAPAFVVVHGLGDNLESYLGHAELLRRRGHAVLLLDLRAHGGSEGSLTTLGGLESHDVGGAMRWLRDNGLAGNGIGLMGHSMGAVAVLLAAADQPDVRAVIVEAPYDSYRSSVAHHAKLLYGLPPWFPLIPMSIAVAEWRAGFDADAIDCVAAARRIRAPLLAIVDGADPRMPEPVVRRIVDAHPGPHRLWVAAGAGHVGAFFHPDWASVVGGFLDANAGRR